MEDRDSKGGYLPGLAIGGVSVRPFIASSPTKSKEQVDLASGPSILVSDEPLSLPCFITCWLVDSLGMLLGCDKGKLPSQGSVKGQHCCSQQLGEITAAVDVSSLPQDGPKGRLREEECLGRVGLF